MKSNAQMHETVSPSAAYATARGTAILGDSRNVLEEIADDSLDLVITSPPYALVEQKEYGNVGEAEYVKWFRPFAETIYRKLKPAGSLVLNVGGAWVQGSPTRSLYPYRLVIDLCDKVSFTFCQEFFWFNPAKMPAPIEWVNKARERVKDSVEYVFWLSKSARPKARNSNVLTEYSDSMRRLLRTGKYNWGKRPSGHNVGKNWGKDRNGAIASNLIVSEEAREFLDLVTSEFVPNNLLVQSNTDSQNQFFQRCREHGFQLHPARFPPIIPEFFIRFLTDEDDTVCDPFAGSNLTGFVAEELDRDWVAIEKDHRYFTASSLRFHDVVWVSETTSL